MSDADRQVLKVICHTKLTGVHFWIIYSLFLTLRIFFCKIGNTCNDCLLEKSPPVSLVWVTFSSSQLLHQSKTWGNNAPGVTACGRTGSRYSRTTCKRGCLVWKLGCFHVMLHFSIDFLLVRIGASEKELFFLLRISLSSFLSLCVPALAYHLMHMVPELLQDRLMSLFHVWTIWAHR